MENSITYSESKNDHSFCAYLGRLLIGKINFLYVGIDRLVIESMSIDDNYTESNLCLDLVRRVADYARNQHRKIICMCPRAQYVLNKYPEFDDVRFIRMHL